MTETTPRYFTDFKKEFSDFRKLMVSKFDQIDKKFDQIDQKFVKIDHRFNLIDERFEKIEVRLVSLEHRMTNMDMNFVTLIDTVKSLDYKLHILQQTCATKEDLKPIYEYIGRNEPRATKLEDIVLNDHRPRIKKLEKAQNSDEA